MLVHIHAHSPTYMPTFLHSELVPYLWVFLYLCNYVLLVHYTLKHPLSLSCLCNNHLHILFPSTTSSSLSVNNPSCPVYHTSVLETARYTHVLEKGCETQLWLSVSVRYSLVSQRPRNSCSRTRTHTHLPHIAHTLCLELWVPLFTKEQGCFMCVWLSLFQLAWNSRSRSESLYNALRGGLDVVCEHSTPTFCGCTWLSECVCLCLRSWWQRTFDLLHSSWHNRCIQLLPLEAETVSVLVTRINIQCHYS